MSVTAQQVNDLRQKTGAGMMECKKALIEANGNMDQAVDVLRKRGLAAAAKKADRVAAEGKIGSYIHAGGQIGVLVEVNCETDFVGNNEDFQTFVKDICLHVAANKPQYLVPEEIPASVIEKEKEIAREQLKAEGKPAAMLDKIAEGKLQRFYKEFCLMEQGFVKDPNKSVKELVNELTAKIGEKIAVRRFVRWEMGEGIQKRQDNFAEEVAAQAAKK